MDIAKTPPTVMCRLLLTMNPDWWPPKLSLSNDSWLWSGCHLPEECAVEVITSAVIQWVLSKSYSADILASGVFDKYAAYDIRGDEGEEVAAGDDLFAVCVQIWWKEHM